MEICPSCPIPGRKRRLKPARARPCPGRVRVPGDKSISHRALILGALAVGETRISGLLEGEDVLNTAKAMRALGARVERQGDGVWSVRGVGVAGFAAPEKPLDFGNSGTGCRLAMGAVAGSPIAAIFDGDASLRTRPMRRILDPLEQMGARSCNGAEGGRLPLTLEGARDPDPDRLSHAGRLGADQVRRAARGAGGARRHHGDREGVEPRPHRIDADAFRRRGCPPSRMARMAGRFRSKVSRSSRARRSWFPPIRRRPRSRWSRRWSCRTPRSSCPT